MGAKYEIYKLMNRLAEEGVSIIMVSSELPEILRHERPNTGHVRRILRWHSLPGGSFPGKNHVPGHRSVFQWRGAQCRLLVLSSRSCAANLSTYTMILALAFIWILFGFLTDWIFFSPRNMSNLFRQMTIVSFLSIGMVLVIVTGNIDLSVGSAVGLVSAVVAFLQAVLLPPLLSVLFTNMDPATMGLVNTMVANYRRLGGGAAYRRLGKERLPLIWGCRPSL